MNKEGDLKTNAPNEGPNAVTWGVFPGKEIVQPTIVETVSFLAWKDEFYRLGQQWANCHAAISPSRYVIEDVIDTWYLLNIVHNDFHVTRGIFPVFDGLKVSDMDKIIHNASVDAPATNGHATTNGTHETNGVNGQKSEISNEEKT